MTASYWAKLIGQCGEPLGTPVPHVLAVRDEAARLLATNRSVNLVVERGIRWQGLIDDLLARAELRLARLDLYKVVEETEHEIVRGVLDALGASGVVPQKDHLATVQPRAGHDRAAPAGAAKFRYRGEPAARVWRRSVLGLAL